MNKLPCYCKILMYGGSQVICFRKFSQLVLVTLVNFVVLFIIKKFADLWNMGTLLLKYGCCSLIVYANNYIDPFNNVPTKLYVLKTILCIKFKE